MSDPPPVDYQRFCLASLALLCTADSGGVFRWVNPAFERALGYSAAELRAFPFLELVHPEDRAATVQTAALRASGLPVTNFTNRYRCADGSYKWLSWSATQDAQGIVYASARDITAQKKMEADLSRLALIAACTANSVVITDAAGRIEWVNEGFTRVSGYLLAESIGRKPGDLLQGPETDPAVVAHMRFQLALGLGFNVEILNYSKNGRRYWLNIDVQPLSDTQGDITGFMAIQLDISARKLAEQSLQENTRLLTQISKLAKIGAWQVDVERNHLIWSDQVRLIYEVEPDFVPNLETATNFYHPSVREEVQSLMARAIETGEGWDGEWPAVTAKGNGIWLRIISEPQFKHGRCVTLNGTVEDITLNRQRLDLVRQSKLYRRELLTAIPDALLRINPAGKLFDLHYPLGFPSLTDPSGAAILPPVAHAIRKMLDQPHSAGTITSQCELGGLTLELRLAPTQSDDSRLVLVHDITERKASENRLATAVAWQTAFSDFAGFGVIGTSPSGLIVSFNRTAEAMLGYSAAEVIDRTTPAVFHLEEEIVARASVVSGQLGIPIESEAEVFFARARRNLPNTDEWTFVHKDGSHFSGLLSLTSVRNPAGEITGFLGIVADITVQKDAARQLTLARQAAEDASRAKSTFLANMSHEIRTPLNGILGFASILADTPLLPDQREYVNTLRDSTEALRCLVNDILDFSKIEAGRMTLDALPCDARQIAVEVCELLSPRCRSSAVEIVLDWGLRLPRFVLGDAGRIRQVLLNLAGNALKFTEKGTIVIQAHADAPHSLRVSITDTGIGIETSQQNQLFSDFTQVDSSSTRRFGGTGLGLVISRRLIEAMGGQLDFESTCGVGSTFSFRLPTPADAPLPDPPPPSRNPPPHVLIVDDLPAAGRVLADWCQAWGWPYHLATSAAAAVAALAQTTEPFTLGLIDASLVEIASRLPGLPLIALASAPSGQTDAQNWLRLGFAGVFAKPLVRPEQLHHAITDLLHPSPAAPFSRPPSAPTLHGHRILVVEDNPANQTLARLLLQKLGYQVDVANDGLAAVSLAETNTYDLILMDCQMPNMDGFAATAAIRSRSPYPPIIALTANAIAGNRERCLAAGMDDYITKPFHIAHLKQILAIWIKPSAEEIAAPVS